MSFTTISGCCSGVLLTAVILEVLVAVFCQKVGAPHVLLGVHSQPVQGPQNSPLPEPSYYSWAFLQELWLLGAEFSAAATASFCLQYSLTGCSCGHRLTEWLSLHMGNCGNRGGVGTLLHVWSTAIGTWGGLAWAPVFILEISVCREPQLYVLRPNFVLAEFV